MNRSRSRTSCCSARRTTSRSTSLGLEIDGHQDVVPTVLGDQLEDLLDGRHLLAREPRIEPPAGVEPADLLQRQLGDGAGCRRSFDPRSRRGCTRVVRPSCAARRTRSRAAVRGTPGSWPACSRERAAAGPDERRSRFAPARLRTSSQERRGAKAPEAGNCGVRSSPIRLQVTLEFVIEAALRLVSRDYPPLTWRATSLRYEFSHPYEATHRQTLLETFERRRSCDGVSRPMR